ncbi:hypothetical protein [Streptosporangium saharense]|uniref:Uncharacterized protein n=1 Tax=Streptosporangium saharense TaxID=1706840 RepID=A0A7W7QHW7_9ACTN|nr:hypothetical protein [Streptosporangium saharense]MBB4913406.1 hypothetical protein [Streptosporangium saharense]
MAPLRGLALFVLAATTVATIAPANAAAGTASDDSVRYAWVKGCTKKDLIVPCGAVTLTLRSGRTITLADARVTPRRANGKIDKKDTAPLTVSGDGRYVSYFRGDRLVIRDVNQGTARPLPGGADVLPPGVGQDDVDVTLSAGGSLAVIAYESKLPPLIVNLRNGRTTRLAAKTSVLTLSPDGRSLLTRRDTEGNTAEFTVLDANGGRGTSRSVPLAVFDTAQVALADNATTVALLDKMIPAKPRLRTYDMATDTLSKAVLFSVPKGEEPQRLYWDTDSTLTLWTGRGNKRDGAFVSFVKRTVDPGTATTRKLDSFTVKSSLSTWHLPGE